MFRTTPRKACANPGNADRGRGASAIKDGARLVYTLTTMNEDEASRLGIPMPIGDSISGR